jgi:hypothetical protein
MTPVATPWLPISAADTPPLPPDVAFHATQPLLEWSLAILKEHDPQRFPEHLAVLTPDELARRRAAWAAIQAGATAPVPVP